LHSTDTSMVSHTVGTVEEVHIQPSPISPSTSTHILQDSDITYDDTTSTNHGDNDWKSECYLSDLHLHLQCAFTDDVGIPMAKPSHHLQQCDLRPVQCIQSFLYLVYRKNVFDDEVSFFKVQAVTVVLMLLFYCACYYVILHHSHFFFILFLVHVTDWNANVRWE
jgi:hypothetical protein